MFVRKQTGHKNRILLETADRKRTHLIPIIVKVDFRENDLKFVPEYPESTGDDVKAFVQKWIDTRINKYRN